VSCHNYSHPQQLTHSRVFTPALGHPRHARFERQPLIAQPSFPLSICCRVAPCRMLIDLVPDSAMSGNKYEGLIVHPVMPWWSRKAWGSMLGSNHKFFYWFLVVYPIMIFFTQANPYYTIPSESLDIKYNPDEANGLQDWWAQIRGGARCATRACTRLCTRLAPTFRTTSCHVPRKRQVASDRYGFYVVPREHHAPRHC
jgi:hypothetical protein